VEDGVKPGVVTLDHDGTIADHGVLHPAVRVAIRNVRERGITVVLVAGRTVDELRRLGRACAWWTLWSPRTALCWWTRRADQE
jgi:hypothetical protein